MLLLVSDVDFDMLYGWFGYCEVSILLCGYGNCWIISMWLKNVWWVQYFNSMDMLIFNFIEVVGMLEVVFVLVEDFVDFVECLCEYFDMMSELIQVGCM